MSVAQPAERHRQRPACGAVSALAVESFVVGETVINRGAALTPMRLGALLLWLVEAEVIANRSSYTERMA